MPHFKEDWKLTLNLTATHHRCLHIGADLDRVPQRTYDPEATKTHFNLHLISWCSPLLKNHKLKLAPTKCHLLKSLVKFLGYVICADGVRTDSDKMKAIANVGEEKLMESDGVTPSWKKIWSSLGMVFYSQHFIADCSARAKPLFRLLSGWQVQSLAKKGR